MTTPARALEAALWFAYHERNWARAADWLHASPACAAPVYALLGARDGEAAPASAGLLPVPAAERLGSLARRLIGAAPD